MIILANYVKLPLLSESDINVLKIKTLIYVKYVKKLPNTLMTLLKLKELKIVKILFKNQTNPNLLNKTNLMKIKTKNKKILTLEVKSKTSFKI